MLSPLRSCTFPVMFIPRIFKPFFVAIVNVFSSHLISNRLSLIPAL